MGYVEREREHAGPGVRIATEKREKERECKRGRKGFRDRKGLQEEKMAKREQEAATIWIG